MTTRADVEGLVDRIVQRRLATDRSYLHAETAEEQAKAEQQITDEVWDSVQAVQDGLSGLGEEQG